VKIEEADRVGNANTTKHIPVPTVAPATVHEDKENQHDANPSSEVGRGAVNEAQAHPHCGQILIHPYRSYKLEGLCLHCRRRRDTRLASFEVNAIRETVYRESISRPTTLGAQSQRRFESQPWYAQREGGGKIGGGHGDWRALPLKIPMPMSTLGESVALQAEGSVVQQQQQQSPWSLTLPPAEIPKTGWTLAGMRDGEWI
jgi:hypothetical protein